MAMAGSPIVKTIFGDPRASRDKETIRQMLAEFDNRLSKNVDLVLISDSSGGIIYADSPDADVSRLREMPSARAVAEHQRPAQSFFLLGGQLFHLAVTPVILHSGSVGVDNTMAVLVAGSELNRRTAQELKLRANSDVLFFAGDRLCASSLDPRVESQAAERIAALAFGSDVPEESAELTVAGEDHLAFIRQLFDGDGRRVGYVVVLHSLAGASMLFHAISSRLMFVGTTSVVLILIVSYFSARRITRPIESLVMGARELGKGHYDSRLDVSADGEIGQLATAFEQMRQSIKQGQAVLLRNERLATVGQMASGIIHDLRSPLAAISTAATLFAHSTLSTEQRQILANSQVRAAQRMGGMLKELLEFSRGRYELKIEDQELLPLINSVVKELITPETSSGVTAIVNVPAGLRVRVDEERAQRMFENLLVNSIQAMPDGGTITIRAEENGKKVSINIADSGSGIPPQLRERLFEPFASVGKTGGTGLGLAIARSIAETHGGRLTLASAIGEPADFCIELPLHFEA
jgi:signal transduction histidine kinase